MSLSRIKTFDGGGRVFSGDSQISSVRYHLEVFRKTVTGSTLSGDYQMQGMGRIEGTVKGHNLPVGIMLKLVTAEGYSVEFFVTNPQTGAVTVSGTILDRDGNSVI